MLCVRIVNVSGSGGFRLVITPRYLRMHWQGREFFVTKYSCLVAVCGILYHSRFSVRLLLYMANNALLRTVTAFCSCVQHQLKVILTEREREREKERVVGPCVISTRLLSFTAVIDVLF